MQRQIDTIAEDKTSLIHKQTISAEQRTSETTNEDEEIGFAILNIYL